MQHKCTGGFVFIGNDAVQNGILNGTLQGTYLLARRKAESLHDFFTTDRRLEITDTVAFLQILQLLAYQLKIIKEAFLTLHILGSNVGFAQCHQVVYIITCLKQEAAHCRVGHHIIRYHNGTHVQAHHFLHIFHLLIHRELHLAENIGYHLLANEIMVMERPARTGFPTLGGRLGYIMQKSCPA